MKKGNVNFLVFPKKIVRLLSCFVAWTPD